MDFGTLAKAKTFARAAHMAVGQKRKYTGEPYHVHTEEVAEICMGIGLPSQFIAVALLHDVIEDTHITEEDLYQEFGPAIASGVEFLTSKKTEDTNRSQRHEAALVKLGNAPEHIQTVKVADLISNTRTIVKYDPNFAKRYLVEKEETLKVLTKANPDLVRIAQDILLKSWAMLKEQGVVNA